jgi:D-alanine-D-alanine ligase
VRKKKLRVLLAFDVEGDASSDEAYEHLMATAEDWSTEGHVLATLRENGHEVGLGPIVQHPRELLDRIDAFKPDVVWNSIETLRSNRYFESHLVALLELVRVPFTGAGLVGMVLCKDKALSKKILKHHRIPVPPFVVSQRNRPLRRLDTAFPAFVKPLASDGSMGIARDSFAQTEEHALKRVSFLHESLDQEVIVEEYIAGRELYVGVLGNRRPQILPVRELKFANVPDGEPTYASYKAKWDDEYRERWGIQSVFAEDLPEKTAAEVARIARRTYGLLQMRGYGRIDMRLRPDGKLFVMEANPNPEIAKHEDFSEAAARAGLDYNALIERIVRMAFDEAD